MEKIWKKSWPEGIPTNLSYLAGERPIHDYLRLRAGETPHKTALIFYGREVSYAELNTASDRFGAWLAAQGVVKGDRVGIFMGNCPQYLIAHFGAQKIGAIVCPCSPLFKEMELAHELNDAGVKVLVSWDILMPVAKEVLPRTQVAKVVATNLNDYLPEEPHQPLPEMMQVPKQAIPGTEDLLAIVSKDQGPLPETAIDLHEDIGLLQYTGGTTGLPKGCMLSYHAALFKTAFVATVAGITAESICLVTMPIFHIAGMLAGMNSSIYAGATQILITQFDPLATIRAIDTHKASFWYSAVPMNVAIMAHPAAQECDLSSLDLCLTSSFGIQLTETIAAQWAEAAGGCPLIEGAYGLSESHTADTFMPQDGVKFGTTGIPGYQQEFKIVDLETATTELPVGESGEIVLRNPAVFKGYWNQPAATAACLKDGWLYTGDIGKFDAEGYLHLLGRKKEMIKVSGYSVFPEEVELMLARHPAVAQSAVIGVPDPKKGEAVKAFIVLAPGQALTADDLRAWAKENMSAYKCPAQVAFRESLPTLGTGKLLRRALKEEETS